LATCERLLTEFASLARFVPRPIATEAGRRRRLVALALALACGLAVTARAGAADVGALQAKLDQARNQAGALAQHLQATQAELGAAQQQAAAAAAREQRLSGLLSSGRERAARLAVEVAGSQRRLAVERARLGRARLALARRLVAIYESGSPSTASVILGSGDVNELTVRTEYLQRIQDSDTALAARVAQVRDAMRHELALVDALKARADAYDERLVAARSQIAAARGGAEAAASRLRSLATARQASLSTLKAQIGGWVGEIEAAERASHAEAEATVGRWLGGPYAIPTYIVMCESGGNYSALNSSSGAGGAYQILPSTWALYGGHGAPQDAPKSEQDAIAAKVWAASGPSAWACG
jgi:septal ring factor EnvC (AmiA/AmiB activator)